MKKSVTQILVVLSAVLTSVIISHYLGYINTTNIKVSAEEEPEKKSRVLVLKERNIKTPKDNSPFIISAGFNFDSFILEAVIKDPSITESSVKNGLHYDLMLSPEGEALQEPTNKPDRGMIWTSFNCQNTFNIDEKTVSIAIDLSHINIFFTEHIFDFYKITPNEDKKNVGSLGIVSYGNTYEEEHDSSIDRSVRRLNFLPVEPRRIVTY